MKTITRSKLLKECWKLYSRKIRNDRGNICEVHNKKCKGIGCAHILPVSTHPRLRFCEANIIVACWFGGHFHSHHNHRDPRAKDFEQAILRKFKKNKFEEVEEGLKIIEAMQPKHTTHYLMCLYYALKKEAK